MNSLPIAAVSRPASFVLPALCLALTMWGCQPAKTNSVSRATGTGAATTPASASDTQKKIQDLDKAITATKNDKQTPPAIKQSYVAAMERAKADLQAKAK